MGAVAAQYASAAVLVIRSPGTRAEAGFAVLYIKCGQCAQACPYDTLKMATAGDKIPIDTPYYIPRGIPCYMRSDIPCTAACSTGSLDSKLNEPSRAWVWL